MRQTAELRSTVFWIALGVTLAVWILRGLGILTFIPGGVIWLLLLLTVGTGVFNMVQSTRR
ncbi:MAG: hypothetical protein IGR76_18430 [Synechococcales cyanobacterium T60_A2020_003]|nr:hypothetical protein [Synechococcales cyanobacterium T60_A2020_003]